MVITAVFTTVFSFQMMMETASMVNAITLTIFFALVRTLYYIGKSMVSFWFVWNFFSFWETFSFCNFFPYGTFFVLMFSLKLRKNTRHILNKKSDNVYSTSVDYHSRQSITWGSTVSINLIIIVSDPIWTLSHSQSFSKLTFISFSTTLNTSRPSIFPHSISSTQFHVDWPISLRTQFTSIGFWTTTARTWNVKTGKEVGLSFLKNLLIDYSLLLAGNCVDGD